MRSPAYGARCQRGFGSGRVARVPWERLAENPRLSESLVTLLVMRLRERAQAVDGTGGDGGRGLFEYTDDGELGVYEAK